MGELHLEVILDRIRNEYKIDASLGKLQVAYREAPTNPVTITGILFDVFYHMAKKSNVPFISFASI